MIHYIDVHGRTRTAEFIEHVDGLVKWHRDKPACPAARYRIDGEWICQVPEDAWALVKRVDHYCVKCHKFVTFNPCPECGRIIVPSR